MDYDAWEVDLDQATARHTSGFAVVVEGSPSDPSGISPTRFPEGLSALEEARLLRSGMQAFLKAARRSAPPPPSTPKVTKAVTGKGRVAAAAHGTKRNRPVLSLKR